MVCGAKDHPDCRPIEVGGLEMTAEKEILPGAAEIVSVQEGGRHRDGNQEDLDSDDEGKSAMFGHPELVAGAPVKGEELVYFAERKVSKERKFCPVFESVDDDAEEISSEIEVKVLEAPKDGDHGDVQQSVELQDVDGLDVVTVLEAQAHQAPKVGGDQDRVSQETPLRRSDPNLK